MGTGAERSWGTLTSWNDERGFGFVESLAGAKVFAHISAFPARAERPQHGESISYLVERGADGKSRARDIRYTGPGAESRQRSPQQRGSQRPRSPLPQRDHASGGARRRRAAGAGNCLVILAFIAFALVVNANWPIPLWVVGLYVLASVICFAVYASDKSAARKGSWRVPENTLHLLAVIGGWPGAICAQQMLRHKTQKRSFRAVFWVTVAVNVLVFAVLTTPIARLLLAALSG
ncbi:uncharacterized membrane protein YsdA (DUF1294 family) [Microterricola gilva]|uniref:Uncharacterized membrane protein YsdA (DUF1294 family) n=1 Tax=Microterricola gilva TaxID=393267 RepID=A0A4Q8APM6_9MICO|nr:DUF1294 domain-containing protein [Microterricola gilva]RZU66043.1 uncharacterized membrane protein YsdA (DUF1294 family) [Microterricola gilva]